MKENIGALVGMLVGTALGVFLIRIASAHGAYLGILTAGAAILLFLALMLGGGAIGHALRHK